MRYSLHLVVPVAAAGLLVACRHEPPAVATPQVPMLESPQLAAPTLAMTPNTSTLAAPLLARADTAREPHVVVDTHARDEDVRPLLEFVAATGGYRLLYPASLTRKVRVSLINVPVSVALTTLLELADLTLEPTAPGARPPLTRPVVFYELPVNIDSLSADAIVKRFGVSRAVADLLVNARSKP